MDDMWKSIDCLYSYVLITQCSNIVKKMQKRVTYVLVKYRYLVLYFWYDKFENDEIESDKFTLL